jgi:hypothetical protein
MGTKGRGWRRIGIVLSVIWFVGFFAWVWTNDVQQKSEFAAHQVNGCYLILSADNESLQYIKDENERETRSAANWRKYHDCEDRVWAFFTTEVQASHSAAALAILLAIDLAAVLIGWLTTWSVVLVVRWIGGRGFAPA